METNPLYTPIELNKVTHTFQKFLNTPMYTTKGYLDTLVVWLNLAPFATNGNIEMLHVVGDLKGGVSSAFLEVPLLPT
jgi:hypothetical protein